MFVRADVEFEDGLNMDFLLHKPLYFKEPVDNKTSNTTINISIFDDGMIQIEETKKNQNPLILTYQVNKTYIQQFFEAMKQNLGSETTYDPSCVGGWSRSFTLYCESGNVFEYHGNYCTDSNENSLTTNIVEELLTKCQIVI